MASTFTVIVKEYNKAVTKEKLRKIRGARKEINKQLRPAMKQASQAGVDAVRQKVQEIPAKRDTGLRAGIAKGTKASVSLRQNSVSASIKVSAAKLPPSKRSLPKKLNSDKGWRHPLFGDKKHWYHQAGHPYFETALEPKRGEMEDAIREAMRRVLGNIS